MSSGFLTGVFGSSNAAGRSGGFCPHVTLVGNKQASVIQSGSHRLAQPVVVDDQPRVEERAMILHQPHPHRVDAGRGAGGLLD